MAGISATCSRKYTAVHNSGTRNVSTIRWVVIHDTEGDTAAGAAVWFTNPASGGSTHLVVDDDMCFRTLSNEDIPWGAEGANAKGFHIEIAGYAKWTRAQFGIPARWVGPYWLRLGRKGVTTHADCAKAFGGNHTDPGAGFPKDKFMEWTRQYVRELSV
jgi:N-acetyl-anhydromuramyl-L-alanine amidase AmpD